MKLFYTLLILLLCLLFFGCEVDSLFYQEVTITISEKHPWQEAMHTNLWHTLVYSDGKGSLATIHLEKGVQSVTLNLRGDCLTVFCAYPLSSLFPFGGYYQPGESKMVSLTQNEGALAKLLLDSYQYNPLAVENINGGYLFSHIKNGALVDGQTLMLDLLNGSFTLERITLYEPLEVNLEDIPQGYWIGEKNNQEPFWSYWGRDTRLLVEGGVQRYLNLDRSLSLTVYGDLQNKRCVTSLGKAPSW